MQRDIDEILGAEPDDAGERAPFTRNAAVSAFRQNIGVTSGHRLELADDRTP